MILLGWLGYIRYKGGDINTPMEGLCPSIGVSPPPHVCCIETHYPCLGEFTHIRGEISYIQL